MESGLYITDIIDQPSRNTMNITTLSYNTEGKKKHSKDASPP